MLIGVVLVILLLSSSLLIISPYNIAIHDYISGTYVEYSPGNGFVSKFFLIKEKVDVFLTSNFTSSKNVIFFLCNYSFKIIAVCIIFLIILSLFLTFYNGGLFTSIIAISDNKMSPNFNNGDIGIIVPFDTWNGNIEPKRNGDINYKMFGDYGDVIVYRPYGQMKFPPQVTRVLFSVKENEPISENKYFGIDRNYTCPYDGLLTKKDNELYFDQYVYMNVYNTIEPIKEDWLIGKVILKIPLLGYLLSNILAFSILCIILFGFMRYLKKKDYSTDSQRVSM